MDKTSKLKKIRDEVLNLRESPLYEYRTSNNYFPVIGEGSHDAEIMFIGEAPGKNEAEQARPFCGAAGRVLDELIAHIDLERSDVYITNIVKDRPPENRDPTPAEIELYAPFVDRQIDIIEPRVIATLGRFSSEYILNRYGLAEHIGPMGRMHGQTFEATTDNTKILIIPLFHPAAALYDNSKRAVLERDFEILKAATKQ